MPPKKRQGPASLISESPLPKTRGKRVASSERTDGTPKSPRKSPRIQSVDTTGSSPKRGRAIVSSVPNDSAPPAPAPTVTSFAAKRADRRKQAKKKRRTASGVVPSTIRAQAMTTPAISDDDEQEDQPRSLRVRKYHHDINEIVFRQMELKDCASSYHLGEKVFTAKRFPSLYRTFDQFEVIEKLSGDSSMCLVAEHQKKVVGFVLGCVITKRKGKGADKYGYIEWVAVDPGYQRCGVGTRLCAMVVDVMLEEGIKRLSADTGADNGPAIKFLTKLGFGERKAHVYMSQNLDDRHERHERHEREDRDRDREQDVRSRRSNSVHSGDRSERKRGEHSAVIVRQMELDDLHAVFQLGERMFTAERFPNLYLGWDEYEVMDMFDTDSQSCLVAEYQQQIVGFVLGNTIEKSRSAWTYGYLRWLGVSPDVQRLGVGRKLYSAFQDLMEEEKVRMLIIDTQADNLPAIKFFTNMGFGSQSDHFYFSRPAGRLEN
eukprot:TRINITY_DN13480_c0_g1_i1.p1 TRINITY_DN13480_c0_g1~~TRINITY_DN13480_c0_g1_i1.p1  ORF type:complete len:489 (+),score=90.67 TRINITY_DN13480_c0_g1_i1:74-1540(+)